MFKPLARTARTADRPDAGFAETQFLHQSEDDDYSGFAPTEMFDEREELLAPPADATARVSTPAAARAAAFTSHGALERAAATAPLAAQAPAPAADADADEPSIPQSWVTSQWVAAQEAKAHEAASQARAVIAAQRRAEEHVESGALVAGALPRTGISRLRAALEKLLPGEFRSLLPLFIGVTVTMALISAVLPIVDKH
jgi:hypothetical protein